MSRHDRKPGGSGHTLPAAIRSLLACPKCHGQLVDGANGESLICRTCSLSFPIRDGIPVMLMDEATSVAP